MSTESAKDAPHLTSESLKARADYCVQIATFLRVHETRRSPELAFLSDMTNQFVLAGLPSAALRNTWPRIRKILVEEHNHVAKEIGCKLLKVV